MGFACLAIDNTRLEIGSAIDYLEDPKLISRSHASWYDASAALRFSH